MHDIHKRKLLVPSVYDVDMEIQHRVCVKSVACNKLFEDISFEELLLTFY